MKKRIFILILIGIVVFPYWTFAGEREDELVHLYGTLPPNETWMRVTEQLLQTDKSNFNESVIRATNLYAEAQVQRNDYYIRRACYFLVIANYNLSRIGEMNHWFEVYEPMARKTGTLDELYECWQCKIRSSMETMDYQRALEEAREMLDDAKKSQNVNGVFAGDICLGTIYSNIGNLDRSVALFEHAQRLFPKIENLFFKLSCQCSLAVTHVRKGEYKQGQTFLHEMEKEIEVAVSKNPSSAKTYEDIRFFIASLYAYVYLKENKIGEAEACLSKAKAALNPDCLKEYKMLYYEALSLYFQMQKHYDKALAYNDSILFYIKHSLKNSLRYTIQRADIMKMSGNVNGAYYTYKYQTELLDSISAIMYTKQLEQIRENYTAKQTVLDYNRSKVYWGVLVFMLLVGCLLFIVWIFLRVKQTENRLKEANKEMEKALSRVEEINETKSKFLRNMSYCVRLPLNAVWAFPRYFLLLREMPRWMMKLVRE